MNIVSRLRQPGARRALWNIGDQGVSSLNNFVLQFVVARAVAPDHFGAFAIAFAVYSVVVGLVRAVSTAPLGIRFADAAPAEFERAARAATGSTVLASALAGLLCVLVGGVMAAAAHDPSSSLGITASGVLALGVILPGLVLQDSWRQVLLACRRPAASAGLNVLWTLVQTAAVAVMVVRGTSSAVPFVIAWGGSALLTALLAIRLLHLRPRPSAAPGWVRSQWSLMRYMLPEFVVLQGGNQLSVFVVSIVTASTLAAGSLRGANLLMSPIMILAMSMLAFAVPELAKRRSSMSARDWRRAALAVSGGVTLVGVLWGAAFMVAPDSVGRFLLDDSWDGVREVLLPIVIAQAGSAAAIGFAAALYAMDRAEVTLRIHIAYAVLLVLLTTAGAFRAGAVGTAWGSAIAFWAVVPVWFVVVRRVAARTERERLQAPPPAPEASPLLP